ncbi:MAG TPA: uracil-DNA glycosylase [Pyrinomonadaceae bacterium]|nr:uracil-DNA glycosylase [Pyrinomonadaceae bacterium]
MRVGVKAEEAAPRAAEFAALVTEAAACRRCPAMCGRSAVLSESNGRPGARVMFVGEAPGRQGGDRTRVPFSGDQSGRNFSRFIASVGLSREELFITNAALCNPRTASGANRKPAREEVTNCSEFLRRQIEVIDPSVVVTLGAVSLAALRAIHYHPLTLKENAGEVHGWHGRLLVPLYHPSPQVLASHRREAAQLEDYKSVARALRLAGRSP